MTRRLVTAGVMLAAAVFLALFARDVWHWQRAVEDADVQAALHRVSRGAWEADTTLPSSWSRSLLGLDDDLGFRATAMQALPHVGEEGNLKNQRARSSLETSLARIVRNDTDSRRAAIAADYLGVMYYNDPPSPDQAANAYQDPSQSGPSDFLTPEQRAEQLFTAAARLDPNDDNAVRNLELMLRRPGAPPHKGTPRAGGGERLGHKGSGARPGGHGY